jgi:signal transduction histidine kinase
VQEAEYRPILGDKLKKLQLWADNCPENYRNRQALLLAEVARNPNAGAIGDKIQLQQVMLNLVVNAIEATSGVVEGPRELSVSSQKVTAIAHVHVANSRWGDVMIVIPFGNQVRSKRVFPR